MTCWLPSFADLMCWLFSFDGLVDRLFSFAGRVNREGLLLMLVRLLVPVRSAPISGLLLRVSLPAAASRDFTLLTELSLREVLLRIIRLLKLSLDDFAVVEVDGLLVLIELPMREVLL
jgi:hypothetical protein